MNWQKALYLLLTDMIAEAERCETSVKQWAHGGQYECCVRHQAEANVLYLTVYFHLFPDDDIDISDIEFMKEAIKKEMAARFEEMVV